MIMLKAVSTEFKEAWGSEGIQIKAIKSNCFNVYPCIISLSKLEKNAFASRPNQTL